MSRFIPLKEINVTNVFPKEPAPPGLNYYVAIKELPYFNWCTHDWNIFLSLIHSETVHMAGAHSRYAFSYDGGWQDLQPMTEMELHIVEDLGYNPIFSRLGYGPVIWGNQVVGTRWTASQLMVALEVMNAIKVALFDMIEEYQMHLFFPDTPEVYRTRAVIERIISGHRMHRDLFCRDAYDPAVSIVNRGSAVDLVVPIQPLTLMEPMLFTIKLRNDTIGPSYHVSMASETEYLAMNRLFSIQGDSILLGD